MVTSLDKMLSEVKSEAVETHKLICAFVVCTVTRKTDFLTQRANRLSILYTFIFDMWHIFSDLSLIDKNVFLQDVVFLYLPKL